MKLEILILGGRGFLGAAICRELREHNVFTFDRHPGEAGHFQGSILSVEDLKGAATGRDCVINLVGLTPMKKPRGTSYEEVQVQGVRNILSVCEDLGIKKLVQFSALGASKESQITQLRTKGEAENLILQSGIPATIFCPSFVFDTDNEFVKSVGRSAYGCMFPRIPARMQPIFRGDVVKLVRLAVEGVITENRLEIAGPDVMTIFELARKIHHKKRLPCIPIPLVFLKTGMRLAAFLKLFGLSKDQVNSLHLDNTTDTNAAEKYIELTRFDDWLGTVSI